MLLSTNRCDECKTVALRLIDSSKSFGQKINLFRCLKGHYSRPAWGSMPDSLRDFFLRNRTVCISYNI